jgi:hypothetical protein
MLYIRVVVSCPVCYRLEVFCLIQTSKMSNVLHSGIVYLLKLVPGMHPAALDWLVIVIIGDQENLVSISVQNIIPGIERPGGIILRFRLYL